MACSTIQLILSLYTLGKLEAALRHCVTQQWLVGQQVLNCSSTSSCLVVCEHSVALAANCLQLIAGKLVLALAIVPSWLHS